MAIALGVVACAIAGTTLYSSLPNVDDAPARVQAILRSHGGIPAGLRPDARVPLATVAVEDRRFFDHGAVDPVAIGRVIVDSVLHPGVDQGGSTIAQQLAKVLYNEPPGVLGRVKSIGLAFKLEQRYSTSPLLSMSPTAVSYAPNLCGVGRATERYFRRPA